MRMNKPDSPSSVRGRDLAPEAQDRVTKGSFFEV
jgi:hypothetical protein